MSSLFRIPNALLRKHTQCQSHHRQPTTPAMAAISKASISKARSYSKQISLFWFLTAFLFVAALGHVYLFDDSTPVDAVVSRSVDEGTLPAAASANTATTHSDTLPVEQYNGTDELSPASKSAARSSPNGIAPGSRAETGESPFQLGETLVYHHTLNNHQGKEGSVVLDMIMAHAHAFHDSSTYGGSCGEGNDVGRDPEKSLIEAIGLSSELRFECPRENEYEGRKKMLPAKHYMQDGTRGMTPEYVELLRSVTAYPDRDQVFGQDPNRFTIVVHIARGKFSPCRKPYQGFDPYLPNQHYQTLIDKYMKPGARVIMFSQSESYETFDAFREKGYELHLDEAIADVWRNILVSDVAILSRSSFSFAPAIVSKGTVVYTPFWDKPVRGWDTVGKDVLEETEEEFRRLKSTCPVKKNKLEALRKHWKH